MSSIRNWRQEDWALSLPSVGEASFAVATTPGTTIHANTSHGEMHEIELTVYNSQASARTITYTFGGQTGPPLTVAANSQQAPRKFWLAPGETLVGVASATGLIINAAVRRYCYA